VLAGSVIAFILDSREDGRVLQKRSDGPVAAALASPLPRQRSPAVLFSAVSRTLDDRGRDGSGASSVRHQIRNGPGRSFDGSSRRESLVTPVL
jgi:hypothetical protein